MGRTRIETYLLRPAAFASTILVLDIIIASFLFLIDLTYNLFAAVANLTILEFAFLLIVGGCFMSRQPLDDSKRYDESGAPTKSWSLALQGRDMLLTALFLLLMGGLAYILSLIV